MMTVPEKYQISWESFSSHLKEMLQDMLVSPTFADVTLVCDDETPIKANRAVLSACSPVFRGMLSGTSHQAPLVFMRGVGSRELAAILQFMYLGEVSVQAAQVEEFLQVARDLKIKELGTSSNSFLPHQQQQQTPAYRQDDSGRGSTNYNSIVDMGVEDSQNRRSGKTSLNYLSSPTDQDQYPTSISRDHLSGTNMVDFDQFMMPLETEEPKMTVTKMEMLDNVPTQKNQKCTHCDFQAANKGDLLDHWTSEHGDSLNILSCPDCNYVTDSEKKLQLHSYRKHARSMKLREMKKKAPEPAMTFDPSSGGIVGRV